MPKKLAGGLTLGFLILTFGCGQDSASFSSSPSGGGQTALSSSSNGVLARATSSPSPTSSSTPYEPPATATPVAAQANGKFYYPSLSYDGRQLAFTTNSSNLVTGAGARTGNPNFLDALVKDQLNSTYVLASRPTGSSQFANNITERACITSAGDKVLFVSYANNLAYDGGVDPSGNPTFANPLNCYYRTLSSQATQVVSLLNAQSMALSG